MSTKRRNKGAGTCYQTQRAGVICWVAEKRFTTIDGRKIRHSAQAPTEALAWLRLNTKIDKAHLVNFRPAPRKTTTNANTKPVKHRISSTPTGSWTLEEFAHYFTQTRKASKQVAQKELRTLELYVFDHIGKKALKTVTGKDLNQLFVGLTTNEETRNKPALHRNVYKSLSALFNTALLYDIIAKNPLAHVKAPKVRRHKISVEVRQHTNTAIGMLQYMNSEDWSSKKPMEYSMFLLTVLCGLRTGELVGLPYTETIQALKDGDFLPIKQQFILETIDHKTNPIIRPTTKTKDQRQIPLLPYVHKALQKYAEIRKELKPKAEPSLFFIDPHTLKPITTNDFRERYKAWQTEYFLSDCFEPAFLAYSNLGYDKVPDFNPNNPKFRKDYIAEIEKITGGLPYFPPTYGRKITTTIMLDSGLPAHLVAQIVGHSEAVQAKHYYGSQPEASRKALQKVFDHITDPDSPTATKARNMMSIVPGYHIMAEKEREWEQYERYLQEQNENHQQEYE